MEYINKQQILEKAKQHQNNPFGASLIIAEIEKADTVEVKHGEWLFEGSNGDVHRKTCSVCNGLFLVRWYDHTYEYRYCPNCGARMDGDVNDL